MKPKKATILGRTFKIKYVTLETIARRSGISAVGLMDWEKKEILISKTLNEHDTMLTIIHECTHASHFITGLNQIIPGEIQELICETTAALFEDIIGIVQQR